LVNFVIIELIIELIIAFCTGLAPAHS